MRESVSYKSFEDLADDILFDNAFTIPDGIVAIFENRNEWTFALVGTSIPPSSSSGYSCEECPTRTE